VGSAREHQENNNYYAQRQDRAANYYVYRQDDKPNTIVLLSTLHTVVRQLLNKPNNTISKTNKFIKEFSKNIKLFTKHIHSFGALCSLAINPTQITGTPVPVILLV